MSLKFFERTLLRGGYSLRHRLAGGLKRLNARNKHFLNAIGMMRDNRGHAIRPTTDRVLKGVKMTCERIIRQG